jgi:hypothetical protein
VQLFVRYNCSFPCEITRLQLCIRSRRVVSFALILIRAGLGSVVIVAVFESTFVTPIVIDISSSTVISLDLCSSLTNWPLHATRHCSSAGISLLKYRAIGALLRISSPRESAAGYWFPCKKSLSKAPKRVCHLDFLGQVLPIIYST